MEIFGIVIASFLLQDKLEKVQFFQKTFLVANTQIKVVLGMRFLILNNVNIWFAERELVWRTYSIAKASFITRKMEIIDKKEFTIAVLNEDNKTFIMHMTALSIIDSNVYPSQYAQIALLEFEKGIILSRYTDYTNVFFPDSATELSKYTNINNCLINLINDKQPLYDPIYSLRLVELKTLKTYMETNLANGFIKFSKLLTGASILFICKKDGSLRLCVNYQGFNNLTIKN